MDFPNTHAFDWIRGKTFELGGRVWESEQYLVVHVPGKDRLVVGFDNLASGREEVRRVPWAYDLVRSQGWGCLGAVSYTHLTLPTIYSV